MKYVYVVSAKKADVQFVLNVFKTAKLAEKYTLDGGYNTDKKWDVVWIEEHPFIDSKDKYKKQITRAEKWK